MIYYTLLSLDEHDPLWTGAFKGIYHLLIFSQHADWHVQSTVRSSGPMPIFETRQPETQLVWRKR